MCIRDSLCAFWEHLDGGDVGSRVLSFIALLLTRPGAHLVPLLSPVLSLTLTWATKTAAAAAAAAREGGAPASSSARAYLAAELHAPLAAIHLAALRSRWSVFFPKPGTTAANAAAALAARDPAAAATLSAAPRVILEHAGGVLSGSSTVPAAAPGALRAVLNELERCRQQVNLFRSDVFVPLRPHFIVASLGVVVGRHHESLFADFSGLVHALAAEDFQTFYGEILTGYVGSASTLPGLDDGQRRALLELLPTSASDEPSMKRGLGPVSYTHLTLPTILLV